MPAEPLPLSRHEVFHTTDVDRAHAEISRTFCPYTLRIGSGRFDTRLHGVRFDRTALYYLSYGDVDTHITPGRLEDFFQVQIPLAGRAEVICGREQVVSTPRLASVLSPTERLDMHWASGTPHLIVCFDRSALESHLGALLGSRLRRPLVFSLGMDLGAAAGVSWLGVVDLMRQEADRDGTLTSNPVVLRQFETVLMTQLLLAQTNNYTSALRGDQPRSAPPVIRRAIELMEARAAELLTVEDVATAVGVGVRTLQEGFRRHLGTTPSRYLRDIRLDRVHAELTACAPGSATVAEIACRWGFFHLGRFAAVYREKFGESPSLTLRR